MSKFKLKDFATCIRACDDTLEIDPKNVKAYYRCEYASILAFRGHALNGARVYVWCIRRAQALITPVSSGALEFDQAISDLEKAFAVDASNKEVRKLLRELREQRVKQKRLDKETFSGMFDRGELYKDDELSISSEELDDGLSREQRFRKEVWLLIACSMKCHSRVAKTCSCN